jgi:methyl-accepting chemotaxis protein
MDEMTQHNEALVEEINAAIEQTEAQAVDLDRIVDVFSLEDGARHAQVAESGAPEGGPGGVRTLQDRVKAAAKSYLTRGSAALKEEWSEF